MGHSLILVSYRTGIKTEAEVSHSSFRSAPGGSGNISGPPPGITALDHSPVLCCHLYFCIYKTVSINRLPFFSFIFAFLNTQNDSP